MKTIILRLKTFDTCFRSFDKHIIVAPVRGGKTVFSDKSNTNQGLFLLATYVQIGNCFSLTKFTEPLISPPSTTLTLHNQ